MFEIPDAKRVRRDDLYSSDSEAETSKALAADAQAKLQAQLAALYGPIDISSETVQPESEELLDAPAPEEEEAFEFNLFAPVAKHAATTSESKTEEGTVTPKAQRIVLTHSDDEDADLGEGAFIRQRPHGWWMAQITDQMKAEYAAASITPEDLSKWKQTRYYGLEKPWKVTVLCTGLNLSKAQLKQLEAHTLPSPPPSTTTSPGKPGPQLEAVSKKKTKPNKKRRIILRKQEAEKAAEKERQRLAKEKKLAEKKEQDGDWAEKRNARNRERKVKRRERERRKKEAVRLGLPEPEEEEGSEGEGEDGKG